MRKWIKESQDDLAANFSEVGNDSDTASELQLEHQNIEGACTVSCKLPSIYLLVIVTA